DCFSGERAIGGLTMGGLGAGSRSVDSAGPSVFFSAAGCGGGAAGLADAVFLTAGRALFLTAGCALGTRTSPWHFGQRKVCPARLSETISECPEGHLIRSGIALQSALASAPGQCFR